MGWTRWLAGLVLVLAWGLTAQAQEPVAPVEPPGVRGLDEGCAAAASALWGGRAEEAEQLARAAIADVPESPPAGPARHALARCHALIGRAILARDPEDAAQLASADLALRSAWELEPSADLLDELVSVRWLGVGAAPLPVAASPMSIASPAERAALALRADPAVRASTLRQSATAGGPTYSVVLLSSPGSELEEVFVAACVRATCIAAPLLDAWTERGAVTSVRASARIASVGYVPTSRGIAIVVGAELALEGERDGASGRWSGSAVYVRWLERDALEGWSLLTRSRRERWDHALGEGPPARADVSVRWDGRSVLLRPLGALTARLRDVDGRREPASLACSGCWLGGVRPPHLLWPGARRP